MQIIALIKKPIFWLIALAAIVVLVFIVCLAVYIFIIEPSLISKCQNEECVKKIAISEKFNPEDCSKAPSLQFQNKCYYIYEVENKEALKTEPAKYCNSIKDIHLIFECFSKCQKKEEKISLPVDGYISVIHESINLLNTQICEKIINAPELKEECLNGVALTEKSINEKNSALCSEDKNFKVSDFARRTCLMKVSLRLKGIK